MTYEEYQAAVKALEKEFDAKKFALAKEYAMSNNTVNIGDIINDHSTCIIVDEIGVLGRFSGKPQCVYHGHRLTKKLVRFKTGERDTIFQSNLKPTTANNSHACANSRSSQRYHELPGRHRMTIDEQAQRFIDNWCHWKSAAVAPHMRLDLDALMVAVRQDTVHKCADMCQALAEKKGHATNGRLCQYAETLRRSVGK